MCGEDNSSTPRAGARVDLFCKTRGALGNIIFLDPESPTSARATHVRFSPREDVTVANPVLVSIHMTGDMTKPAEDCGLLHQFRLSKCSSSGQDSVFEMALEQPLLLEVGGTGILGRRVSMLKDGNVPGDGLAADGIVGFNAFLS